MPKAASMTPVRQGAHKQNSVRTLRIVAGAIVLAIVMGLLVAQVEFLALPLLAGALVVAAIVHEPRRGILLLSVLVPLEASTRVPHHLMGITGLNPLNLTLLATLIGLMLSAVFPGTRRAPPLKGLPLPVPLLVLMVLPMILAAVHGSFSVELIPNIFGRSDESSYADLPVYLRDLLQAPLLRILYGLLLGLVVRFEATAAGARPFLYGPLVGLSGLAGIFLFNAYGSGASLQEMGSADARDILAAAAGMHPNEISLMFNCGLAWALFTARAESNLGRLFLWGVSLLMVIANLLTFSRGGYFGMMVVVIAYLLHLRRLNWVLVAAAALGIGALFLPQAVLERVATGLTEGDINALSGGRATLIWPLLLPVIGDHWIFGSGIESILWSPPVRSGALFVTQPHNAYLALLLDYGVVGGAMIFSFYVWRWFDLRRLALSLEGGANAAENELWVQFLRATSVMVLVLLVQAVTDNRLTPTASQTVLWLAFGLAFGLRARWRDRELRAADGAASEVAT